MKNNTFVLFLFLLFPLASIAQSPNQKKVSFDEIKLFPLTQQLVGIRRDSLWAIFDSTGQQRTPFRFTDIEMATDSAFVASTTNAAWFGAWDMKSNPIIPEKYHALKILPAGYWQATLYGQSALLDQKGKAKTAFRFFKVLGMPDGRFFATTHHNQLLYAYNADGHLISDRRYMVQSVEEGLYEAIYNPDNHLTLLFLNGKIQEYDMVNGGITVPEMGDPTDWKRLAGGSYDEFRGWMDLKTRHVEQPSKFIYVIFKNDQIQAYDYQYVYTFDRYGKQLNQMPVDSEIEREEHPKYGIAPNIFQLNPSAPHSNRYRKLPAHWGMIVNKLNKRYQLCDAQNKPLLRDTFDQIVRIGQPGLIAVVRKGNKAFRVTPAAELSAPFAADSFLRVEEKYLFYKKGGVNWMQNLLTEKIIQLQAGQMRPVPYSELFIVSGTDTASLYDQNFDKGPFWTGESIFQYEFNYRKPNYLIAKKGGKMGILSQTGKALLPFEYDQISYNEEEYTPFLRLQKDSKIGLFNCLNERAIPAEYDDLPYFFDTSRLILLTKNNKAALFSGDFRQLTDFEFTPQTPEVFGKHFTCLTKDGKYILVDRMGKQVPDAVFDWIEVVEGRNYAFFKKDHFFGCIRQDGKIILEPRHASLEAFTSNAILAGFPDGDVQIYNIEGALISQETFQRVKDIDGVHILVEKDGKYGVINQTGVYTIPLVSQGIECAHGACPLEKNGKTGLVRPDGTVILPPEYDHIWHAIDRSGNFVIQKDGLYGYCNWKGEWLTEIAYDMARPFCWGRAALQKNGKWGYINQQGAIAIPFIFDFAENFGYNTPPEAVTTYEKSHWNIDTSGNLLQEVPYSILASLDYNLTQIRVITSPSNGDGLQYDGSDAWLLKPTGYQLHPIMYDLLVYATPTTKGGISAPFGLMNYAGTHLTECTFDELILSHIRVCDMIPVKKGKKWGFINAKGHTIIPIIYDNVWNLQEPYPNDQWRGGVFLNGESFLIDNLGKKITEK